MNKHLRKFVSAVGLCVVFTLIVPHTHSALAAAKTFTYAEQTTGEKVTSLHMDLGEKVDLKFNGISNWKTYTYKWASSNSKVAVVDAAGVITAVGKGIATIRLIVSGGDGTQYTSLGVTVYVGQVQQVTIGTANSEKIDSYIVEMGKTVILKANGIKDAIGERYTFNWSSTVPSVAKISNDGEITTVMPGLTVIQLSVTKKSSGEVLQATPIAVLVTTSNGSEFPRPTPTPEPTVSPTPAPVQESTKNGITCSWFMNQSVISAGGWFSRAIGLTANITGGSGEYSYYFDVYEKDGWTPILSSSDSSSSEFSFKMTENIEVTVELTIIDSNGKSECFIYDIPKYE